MHRLQELVRLHRLAWTERKISRTLRMGRNTLASYREALKSAGLLDGDPNELPACDVLRAAVDRHHPPATPRRQKTSIERWLKIIDAKHEEGVGPTAIFDYLKLEHEDFDGSLSAVKRRCAALSRARGVRAEDIAIRVETEPGDVAQVDFGYVGKLYDPDRAVLRKAWVFVMTLGFSRHMVARIVFDQKVETWLQLHVECFEDLDGVPKTLVPDNLKAAVIRAAFGVDEESTLNRSYRELARHYDFVVDPTPPLSPEKKGKVEASVRYVKSNYFKAHQPEDIRDARTGLARWLREIASRRKHGTTGKRPGEAFEEMERSKLLPLPTTRFELVAWKLAKPHRDCHVVFRGEFYSVPWIYVGKAVELRVTRNHVTVYHEDEHLWTHTRVARGQRQTVEGHLPEHRAPLRHRSRSHWQELAYALGEPVGDYVRAIFDSDDVLSHLRRVQSIVSFLQKHPQERACNACRRALFYGNYSYAGIKDILQRGLDFQPLPGSGRSSLEGHWSKSPRFSRISKKEEE